MTKKELLQELDDIDYQDELEMKTFYLFISFLAFLWVITLVQKW